MAGKKIRAFAPASLSCFFKIYRHKNPRWAGSYGLGFTVSEGVIVALQKSAKTKVFFNNKSIRFPTVVTVIKKLTDENMLVEISSKLPLGCGFGLSGASALATAYAVNKLFNIKKSNKELAIIAHTAEVKNKTGLGDVVNQYYGGFFLKEKPSSYFFVEKVPVKNQYVYCKCFSKLSTKSILSDISLQNNIEQAGSVALRKTKVLLRRHREVVFRDLIHIAIEFVLQAGLLQHKRTIDTINQIEKNGGFASMMILGNAVYSDTPFHGAIKLKISDKGVHLL